MDYIAYTTDGYTELPIGEEMENCQIIDFVENTMETEYDVKDRLAKEIGIRSDHISVVPFVDKKTTIAIRNVLNYLWKDEKRHYKECVGGDDSSKTNHLDESGEHIFISLQEIAKTFGR